MPKFAAYPVLPELAIAHGASTPNPGKSNAVAYSTLEGDVVHWNGSSWRLVGRGLGKICALLGANVANYFMTAAAGGEPGVSTGFGAVVLYAVARFLSSNYRGLAGKTDGSSGGWFAQLNSAHQPGFSVRGTSAWSEPLGRPLVPSDLGRIHCLVGYDAGTTVKVAHDSMYFQTAAIAVSGFTPNANAHTLGKFGGGNGADDILIVGHLTFRGTPSDAQLQALIDATRVSGDVPLSAAGMSFTHRWSLRETLAGTAVADGQSAPATIADSITAAANDVMTRVQAITVRTIDPSVDGKKTAGVLGFTSPSYLQAASVIFTGSAANQLSIFVQLMVGYTAGAQEVILSTLSGGQGFSLYASGTASLNVAVNGVGDFQITTPTSFPAGSVITVAFVATGANFIIYLNGVQVSTQAMTSITRNLSTALRVGQFPAGTSPALTSAVYRIAGCDDVLSAAEIAVLHAQCASGAFGLPAGKVNPHVYDLTVDMAADLSTVPAAVVDRAGSVALTRVGGVLVVGAGNGLTAFKLGSFLRSAGLGATGTAAALSGEVLVDLVTGDFATASVIVCSGNTTASVGGWAVMTWGSTGSPMIRFYAINTSNASVTIDVAVAAGMRHIAWTYDGSVARLYIDGALVGTSASFVFKPATAGWLAVGAQLNTVDAGVYPLAASTVRGLSVGAFVWSAGEVATASSTGRAAGKVQGVAAKTDRRYSLVDDVADAGGVVPIFARDRAASSSDALYVVHTKLEATRRTERAFGYETAPVLSGFTPVSGTTYYDSSATGHDGGAQTGKTIAVAFRINAQTVNKPRELLSLGTDAGQKATLRVVGANAGIAASFYNGSGFVSPPNITFTASDVGRLSLAVIQWDPSTQKARAFFKRAEIGTGQTMLAFVPGTGNWVRLGMIHTAGTYPSYFAEEITIFGAWTYDGVWSVPEIFALYDVLAAEEDVLAVPGKDGHRWSCKQAIGQSGTLPATIPDLAGASALTRVGAPTLNTMTVHAAGW